MQMRDGVFVTNGKGALTCMRRDTTSSTFASSNRWDGPEAFRQEAIKIGIGASDTGDQSWLGVRPLLPPGMVFCVWQPAGSAG